MRYALIADIHGNLQALRATIEEIRRAGVDRWIVAGDIVGYGAQPNECVEVVAGLDAICVAGNHDLIAVGKLSDDRCIRLARDSLRWTREVLSADARAFLSDLPTHALGDRTVVAHGSLDDPQQYTATSTQARQQLSEMTTRWPQATVLVIAHTHRPWAFAAGSGTIATRGSVRLPIAEPVLINPGAVGQSRDVRARARAAILDLDAGTTRLLSLEYDVGACREALRDAGLPAGSYHLRPSPLRVAARRVRRSAPFEALRGRREESRRR